MRADDINSRESEAGILATLIHKPEWYFYSEQLLPNHFSDRSNSCIYTAIKELVTRGIETVDPYNIIEVLNASEATRKIADNITLEQLQDFVEMSDSIMRSSVEEYKMLVQNVLDAAFRRDAYRALEECKSLCADMTQENVDKRVYELIDNVMTEYTHNDEITEFKDIVDELWKEIEDHQDGNSCGIPFKFPTLNEYVTLEPGELCVVAAPMKGAKSMFCLNTAVDALKQGKSVFYIDSELSSRLFLCRLVSHLTGIEFNRVKSGRYDDREKHNIEMAISWIKEQNFVHLYMPIWNEQNIYTSVKKIHHKFNKLDLLVVDYLKPSGLSNDPYQVYSELGNLTDLIKNDIAGKMGIAALAAAQLTAGNKLADSAKIARNASTIMLLLDKTPDEMEADGEACGNKKLIVQLNRNGMQHAQDEYIDLSFDGNKILLEEAKQQFLC